MKGGEKKDVPTNGGVREGMDLEKQLKEDEQLALRFQLEDGIPAGGNGQERSSNSFGPTAGVPERSAARIPYNGGGGDDSDEEYSFYNRDDDDYVYESDDEENGELKEEARGDAEYAMNLQKQEIDDYYQQGLFNRVEQNLDVARHGPLRMGALPYTAQSRYSQQQQPQVEVVLPPDLLNQSPTTTNASSLPNSTTGTPTTDSPTATTPTDTNISSNSAGPALIHHPPKQKNALVSFTNRNNKRASGTGGSGTIPAKYHKSNLRSISSRPGPKIWFDVSRPSDGDPVFLHLLGNYNHDDEDEQAQLRLEFPGVYAPLDMSVNPTVLSEAAVKAELVHATEHDWQFVDSSIVNPENIQAIIDQAELLKISFRQAFKSLPFAVQFQLERCILCDTTAFSLKVRYAPRRERDQNEKRFDRRIGGRKLLLIFVKVVIPALLRIQPRLEEASLTVQEVFADELWDILLEAKKTIQKGKSCHFVRQDVEEALERARRYVKRVEQLCQTTEEELSHGLPDRNADKDGYLLCIQKRSIWPVAEYKCQFSPDDGRLLATEFELMNKEAYEQRYRSFEEARKHMTALTRRALREVAWEVRDHFLSFSDIPLHDTFRDHLVDWIKVQPQLCHRRYQYLYDKGVGKPNLWLFSPSGEMSRDDFLNRLGSFEKVEATKLGDRISLAFTNTKPVVQLDLEQIVPIPEVIHNGYCFSDGCGVMGEAIARKVLDCYDIDFVPGSIQVRIGGIKGMLTVRKDFPEGKIGIRPSMCKFASEHRLLEVKRFAVAKTNQDTKPKLFNQILLIMHHLKVPQEVFLDLQRRVCAEMAAEYDDSALELLQDPIDYGKISEYVKKNVLYGRKYNKELFEVEDMKKIIQQMKEAKKKVNLRCSVTLMLGVIDEHDFLEEGEVLVGNGMIQGEVLICRPPCNTPGDIQKAIAVPGRAYAPFTHLRGSLVMSAKGSRPLADKLAGGDLDGDEYYIIDEPELVRTLTPKDASDFGSWRADLPRMVQLGSAFSVPRSPENPDINKQLDVFKKVLEHGRIVAGSADAWFYVADKEGPHSELAQQMAKLHVKSLDARKQAYTFEDEQIAQLDYVRSKYKAPHWLVRSTGRTDSTSILGVSFDKWQSRISEMENSLRNRRQPGTPESADDRTYVSEGTEDTRRYDRLPLPQIHWNEVRRSLPEKNPREILIDVTFGRKHAYFSEVKPINFRSITIADLHSLAAMAISEYEASLRKGWDEALDSWDDKWDDSPHDFDVFLVGNDMQEDLAVFRPFDRSDEEDCWEFRDSCRPIKPIVYRRRVTSISGHARILESLLPQVLAPLMKMAMEREGLVDVVDLDKVSLDPSVVSSLNESQQMAVATVASPSFETGFLAIHGPPGTGKTSTIVGMVSVSAKSLVLAPSNAAVANIALKLVSAQRFDTSELVVWGDNCGPSVEFLNPRRRQERYAAFLKRYKKADEDSKGLKLREFASWLKLRNVDSVSLEQLDSLCADPDVRKSVSSARVVLCTLNTAGSTTLRKAAKSRFSLAILDEASQCSEAEFFIATTFPGVERIVIVGDPRQLPATVLSPECTRAGYGESFLGNILKYVPEKVHLLNTQYRMDPQLLSFVNQAFYDNKIKSDDSVKNRQPALENVFRLVSTSDEYSYGEQRQGTSWINKVEVETIKSVLKSDPDILKILEADLDDDSQLSNVRVIVITPYTAQKALLAKELKKVKSLQVSRDISTVDSFQGQEADIVVVSTVRTNDVGFVDDANRLCVALTRARRVLRVVGDVAFFKRLSGHGQSILGQLAIFGEQMSLIGAADEMDAVAWRQAWKLENCLWRPTMNAKFHHCLQQLARRERNIACNTLLAVATPDLRALKKNDSIESYHPRWHMSALRNGGDVHVVWIARALDSLNSERHVGVIEGHFAGDRDKCIQFQNTKLLPASACAVEAQLTAPMRNHEEQLTLHASEIDVRRWLVTDELKNAIVEDTIDTLPEGLLTLDAEQEQILSLSPPLALESRSGTGKTNVLFRHALSYAYDPGKEDINAHSHMARRRTPICFVTVSSNLCRELEKRYKILRENLQGRIPLIRFYSFLDLLKVLLDLKNMHGKDVASACNFWHYVYARTSRERISIEESLLESEIGGVIQGSLTAAVNQKPLTEEEYLAEKRSNIPMSRGTVEGQNKRKSVYKEYDKYRKWKNENNKYDVGDIVLELIGLLRDTDEIFDYAYLDEVQDFSYAAIYLVLNIAGRANARWIAAGDTAQMISPGCSFKFAGLNDTFSFIKHDVKVPPVAKLKRNYRMTRSVLEVGNAILLVLKKHFPEHIEYAQPEIPMKDLGLKVTLVDWEDALAAEGARFGLQQAVVYSGSGSGESEFSVKVSKWANNHPLVLSALDVKGLEFDDVVVAFRKDRKAWRVNEKRVESLRLLRELYVAVTRARRRVVILVNKNIPGMAEFFQGLEGCQLEWTEVSAIMLEFDNETTAEQWFEAGMEYFKGENFSLAESCFNAAGDYAWSHWAQGRRFRSTGRDPLAKDAFRVSSKAFFEKPDFESCLDVMSEIIDIPPWNEIDGPILDAAVLELPDYLPREKVVKLAVYRNNWESIGVDDLRDKNIAAIFRDKREDPRLKEIIRNKCNYTDRYLIRAVLPLVVGDYFMERRSFTDAIKCFLDGKDQQLAERATEKAINGAKEGSSDLLRIVEEWQLHGQARQNISSYLVKQLMYLFESPEKAAQDNAENFMSNFGARIVKLAVESSEADRTILHSFDRREFQEDVEKTLVNRYSPNLIKVVGWYHDRGDTDNARSFAERNFNHWDVEDVQTIVGDFSLRWPRLIETIQGKHFLVEAASSCLRSTHKDLQFAEKLSNRALESAVDINATCNQLRGVWESVLKNEAGMMQMVKKKARSSRIFLLLSLYEEPEETGRKFGSQCYKLYGKEVVELAVKSYPERQFNKGYYPILALFDKEAFESEKPVKTEKSTEKQEQQRNLFSVGQRVQIIGLQRGKEHNKKIGTVTKLRNDKGRYEVKHDNGQESGLYKEQNLRPIQDDAPTQDGDPHAKPTAAATQAKQGKAEQQRRFSVNQRVRISGLQTAKNLNGKLGTITEFRKDGRYGVLIDGMQDSKSFLEEKLSAIPKTGRGSGVKDEDSGSDSDDSSLPELKQSPDSAPSNTTPGSQNAPRNRSSAPRSTMGEDSNSDSSVASLVVRGDLDAKSGDASNDDSSSGSPPPLLAPPGSDSSKSGQESVPPLASDDSSDSSAMPLMDSGDSSDSSAIPDLLNRELSSSGSESDTWTAERRRAQPRAAASRPSSTPASQAGRGGQTERQSNGAPVAGRGRGGGRGGRGNKKKGRGGRPKK